MEMMEQKKRVVSITEAAKLNNVTRQAIYVAMGKPLFFGFCRF